MSYIERAAEALEIEPWRLKGAIERRNALLIEDFTPSYLLFKKELRHIEKGTAVFFGDELRVVRGFPKIPRALYLEPAVKKHFKDRVAVEEKMNGYNVRVALVDGKLFALTRGGFVCPYTTAKLRREKALNRFIRENPELVVCGEAVGNENPYVVHEYPEAKGFGFFCFDIRYTNTNIPLGVEERYKIAEDYGIKNVRLFGIFKKSNMVEETFRIVRELAGEGREGVVLKDPEMKLSPLKYTPSETNTSDLAYAFRFPYEFGREFFFSRIIREGFQAVEWEESEEELERRALRLGKAILYPMVESIKLVKAGEVLTEDFRIRLESEEEIEEVKAFLRRQGISFIVEEGEEEGLFIIKRLRNSTTDKIKAVLRGREER